jgi:hypothetical protein
LTADLMVEKMQTIDEPNKAGETETPVAEENDIE